MLLRSTFGTSFRAPALFEQFLADSTGFVSSLNDPCSTYGNRSQPGDPLYDNCFAEGLDPVTFTPTAAILTSTGGASDLEAETSDAFTLGISYTPDWANFSVALDYFDIKLKDTVASPSVGFILAECYNSRNFSSPFCSRVAGRTPQGALISVDSSFINIGRQQTRGFDVSGLYDRQFPAGRLLIDGTATYIDRQNFALFDDFVELQGRWGFPRWSANTQANWDWQDWRFSWTTGYIGKAKEARQFDPGTQNQNRQNRTPNYFVHSIAARYTASNWQAIFTIRNLFDKDPPVVAAGTGAEGATRVLNTLPGVGYDLIGRAAVVQLSYQF